MVSILTIQDLTSPYGRKSNNPKHIGFTEAIPDFTNMELVTALTNRYYKLTDKASDRLILEIRNRKITINQVENLFKEVKVFSNPFNGHCPCCQSSSHLTKDGKDIISCLICGYDIKYDNPKSILNRIRWKLGLYSFSRLSLEKVKDLVLQKR